MKTLSNCPKCRLSWSMQTIKLYYISTTSCRVAFGCISCIALTMLSWCFTGISASGSKTARNLPLMQQIDITFSLSLCKIGVIIIISSCLNPVYMDGGTVIWCWTNLLVVGWFDLKPKYFPISFCACEAGYIALCIQFYDKWYRMLLIGIGNIDLALPRLGAQITS